MNIFLGWDDSQDEDDSVTGCFGIRNNSGIFGAEAKMNSHKDLADICLSVFSKNMQVKKTEEMRRSTVRGEILAWESFLESASKSLRVK